MEANPQAWIVLAYTLPAEPSRYRVSIWRRLRKLGALYLNEGFWVLPNSTAMLTEVESVIKEVRGFQGTASAFRSNDIEADQGGRLRGRFVELRNEEYAELVGQYDKFLVHIAHARSTSRFTFAEVEELEEELMKLEGWLREIHERDFFGSDRYQEALTSLETGRGELQEFIEETYAAQPGQPAGQPPSPNP